MTWGPAQWEASAAARAAQGGAGKTEPQTAEEFGQYVRAQRAQQGAQVSDQDAAAALAQGGAKSAPAPVNPGARGRAPRYEE